MTPLEILALPMPPNDADAATVRDYLKALLLAVWNQGKSFSGKRPFGNSGWQNDLDAALAAAGEIGGTLDDGDWYIHSSQHKRADELICEAIAAL